MHKNLFFLLIIVSYFVTANLHAMEQQAFNKTIGQRLEDCCKASERLIKQKHSLTATRKNTFFYDVTRQVQELLMLEESYCLYYALSAVQAQGAKTNHNSSEELSTPPFFSMTRQEISNTLQAICDHRMLAKKN